MKTKKRILSAVALSVAAAFGGAPAEAAQFSNIYVFGDSLSDAGYYRGFLASVGLPAAQMGRFSTNPGPIWAEIMGQYLTKGRQVYIEGKIRTRKWQDKEGKDRYTTEIIADQMQMLGGRGGGGGASSEPRSSSRPAPASEDRSAAPVDEGGGGGGGEFDDDIPF